MTRNTCVPAPTDIMYTIHEGTYRVLAIWPSPSGKLTRMIDYWCDANLDTDLKPWVFMEVPMMQDRDGNSFPDHHIRGVRSGDLVDGQCFLDLCRHLGLIVKSCDQYSNGWYVPFANGKDARGDFDVNDLRYLRSDKPPTREELKAALSKR